MPTWLATPVPCASRDGGVGPQRAAPGHVASSPPPPLRCCDARRAPRHRKSKAEMQLQLQLQLQSKRARVAASGNICRERQVPSAERKAEQGRQTKRESGRRRIVVAIQCVRNGKRHCARRFGTCRPRGARRIPFDPHAIGGVESLSAPAGAARILPVCRPSHRPRAGPPVRRGRRSGRRGTCGCIRPAWPRPRRSPRGGRRRARSARAG